MPLKLKFPACFAITSEGAEPGQSLKFGNVCYRPFKKLVVFATEADGYNILILQMPTKVHGCSFVIAVSWRKFAFSVREIHVDLEGAVAHGQNENCCSGTVLRYIPPEPGKGGCGSKRGERR